MAALAVKYDELEVTTSRTKSCKSGSTRACIRLNRSRRARADNLIPGDLLDLFMRAVVGEALTAEPLAVHYEQAHKTTSTLVERARLRPHRSWSDPH